MCGGACLTACCIHLVHRPVNACTCTHELHSHVACCRTNPRLFFELLLKHTEELLPLVYTPTVGEACQRYSHLPGLHVHGLFLRATDAATFLNKLRSWPQQDIR